MDVVVDQEWDSYIRNGEKSDETGKDVELENITL